MKVITPDSPPILLRSKVSMEEVRKLSLLTPSEVAFRVSSYWPVVNSPSPCSTAPSQDHSTFVYSPQQDAKENDTCSVIGSDESKQPPTITSAEVDEEDDPTACSASFDYSANLATPRPLAPQIPTFSPANSSPSIPPSVRNPLRSTSTIDTYQATSPYVAPYEMTVLGPFAILTHKWDYGLQEYIPKWVEYSENHELLEIYSSMYLDVGVMEQDLATMAVLPNVNEVTGEHRKKAMRRESEESRGSIDGLWEGIEEGKRECKIAAAEYESVAEQHCVENGDEMEEEGRGYYTLCQIYEDPPHYHV